MLMEQSTEIATDVHRLGGVLELDGRISWYPAGSRGSTPSNAYVLTAPGEALLVDPGLPVIEEPLIRQLRPLVEEHPRLSMLITRPAEFDCITNAGAVLSEFQLEAVYGQVALYQFIGFLPRHRPRPEEEDSAWDYDATDWRAFVPGAEITFAGRTIELLRTPLRLLATVWPYDRATRTLFTSDTFNHVTCSDVETSPLLQAGDPDRTTVEDVRENLLAKFDWLQRADGRYFRDGIEALLADREIDAIAPAHGRVLLGREVVDRHIELLLDALASFVPTGELAVQG